MKTLHLFILLLVLVFFSREMALFVADSLKEGTLFTDIQVKVPIDDTHTRVQAKTVLIEQSLLTSQKESVRSNKIIKLNLFADVIVTATLSKIIKNKSGGFTWLGEIDEFQGSSVIFNVDGGSVYGSIDIPTVGMFVVKPLNDSVHLVEEIVVESVLMGEPDGILPKLSEIPQISRNLAGNDDGSIIDVYVAYDQDASNGYVSAEDAQMYAKMFVAYTNQAYENSNLEQRIWLVGEVDGYDYDDADLNSLSADLVNLKNGAINGLLAKRDKYHADLVLFFVPYTGGNCNGMAYIQTTNNNLGFENIAYSVMEACPFGQTVFAHELGHNMGGRHDWYSENSTASGSNAHGYVDPDNQFRTIMAYNSRCADLGFFCSRVAHFSNPNVTYNGVSTGVHKGTSVNCAVNDLTPNVECDADHKSYFDSTAVVTSQFRDSRLTWTGQVDTNWHNAQNWSMNKGAPGNTRAANQIPRAFDNVFIPKGLARYPILENGTFAARELLIEHGASLTMTSGVLTVGWKWWDKGGFHADGGVVEFGGPIGVRVDSESDFYSIVVDSPDVILVDDLSVQGDLEIRQGASLFAGRNNIIIAGDWHDLGNGFNPGNGTVIFAGDVQSVSTDSVASELIFYNLHIASGTTTFYQDIVVWNDFEMAENITADFLTHTIKVGGTVTYEGTLLGNPIQALTLYKIYFPIMQ